MTVRFTGCSVFNFSDSDVSITTKSAFHFSDRKNRKKKTADELIGAFCLFFNSLFVSEGPILHQERKAHVGMINYK